MKIVLRKLTIINFKGIEHLELNFNEKENFILGQNGSGKTTISDAFHWLLLGKNSNDAKDFEIKPIDQEGNRAEKTENEVSALIEVDGVEIHLRKVHSEKWTKPKGQPVAVFKGNETNCFWNNVPENVSVFASKINAIISEDKLKLFTNTGYFNSMKWSDRRNVLIKMAGDVDFPQLINSNPNFAFIGDIISQGKTIADFKKETAAKKRNIKDELELIPSRVDENKRSVANMERPFERLRTELTKHETELTQIDNAINNKNEAYKLQQDKENEKRKAKYDLQVKANNISDALRLSISASSNKPNERLVNLKKGVDTASKDLATLKTELAAIKTRIENGNRKISDTQKQVNAAEAQILAFREQWSVENKTQLVFDEKEFCCPTCKRGYEPDDVVSKQTELTTNFNNTKAANLAAIVAKADKAKADKAEYLKEIESYKATISELEGQKAAKETDISNFELAIQNDNREITAIENAPKEPAKSVEEQLAEQLAENVEHKGYLAAIQAIDLELEEFKPVDNAELVLRKKELQQLVDDIKKDLLNEAQIKATAVRIQELNEREGILAQELADLERKEFQLMQFTIAQMNDVEEKVNSMFKLVKFRMFDRQVNGEIVEVCDTLVDGKPIHGHAVNTANVINAGLDIINTLSEHYKTYAPVFIDSGESVTDLIPSESQTIKLVVSKAHKQLTISEADLVA